MQVITKETLDRFYSDTIKTAKCSTSGNVTRNNQMTNWKKLLEQQGRRRMSLNEHRTHSFRSVNKILMLQGDTGKIHPEHGQKMQTPVHMKIIKCSYK